MRSVSNFGIGQSPNTVPPPSGGNSKSEVRNPKEGQRQQPYPQAELVSIFVLRISSFPYKWYAAHAPSEDTIVAPSGVCGVHSLPNAGHWCGFFSPRRISPLM